MILPRVIQSNSNITHIRHKTEGGRQKDCGHYCDDINIERHRSGEDIGLTRLIALSTVRDRKRKHLCN